MKDNLTPKQRAYLKNLHLNIKKAQHILNVVHASIDATHGVAIKTDFANNLTTQLEDINEQLDLFSSDFFWTYKDLNTQQADGTG